MLTMPEAILSLQHGSSNDFQNPSANPDRPVRGLLEVTRDPLDRDTTITYDTFALLPLQVTDAIGLTTTAAYDYRVIAAGIG